MKYLVVSGLRLDEGVEVKEPVMDPVPAVPSVKVSVRSLIKPSDGKNGSAAIFHSAVTEGERKLLFSGANSEKLSSLRTAVRKYLFKAEKLAAP
jgi:hypothetical protein